MEKWEDALTELRGLEASELGADYKLTAIREIATPFIRDKMDFADTSLDPSNHEGRFKCQYEVLKQWAYMRVKNDRKFDPSQPRPMDVNAFGKGGWNYHESPAWSQIGMPISDAEGRFIGYVGGEGGGNSHYNGMGEGKGFNGFRGSRFKGGGFKGVGFKGDAYKGKGKGK